MGMRRKGSGKGMREDCLLRRPGSCDVPVTIEGWYYYLSSVGLSGCDSTAPPHCCHVLRHSPPWPA